MDEKDSSMQPEGMESEIEGRTLLIVSHGDPLQILQTKELAAAGTPENDLNIKNTTSSNHLLSHNTATLH
ncbi:hypothetical protein BUALT_Bualt15G0042800 [Buddleja alternifolia]|uniref:Phosphoglycerate mutase n=1 Tax=Buddleja alternifolia TaxID=168488 RepID=A0AAV6WJ26_9LAMI|nr:hypothetical protein BUALT_Bualt15G0042800 [Buddleja alternifolia]